MGRVIRGQRTGAGSVFKAHTHHRLGRPALRHCDFAERHGYIAGTVKKIRHDPGRSSPLISVTFKNRYKLGVDHELMIATEGMVEGQNIQCGINAFPHPGNCLPLSAIPQGFSVHSVERAIGDSGRMARTSGTTCQIIAHANGKTRLRLPSGAKVSVDSRCRGIIGICAGGNRLDKPLLKAGAAHYKYQPKRNVWPKVRGVAMNPVEHPHGGGNHQHIGFASTVARRMPAGRKVGLIAARRTGLRTCGAK